MKSMFFSFITAFIFLFSFPLSASLPKLNEKDAEELAQVKKSKEMLQRALAHSSEVSESVANYISAVVSNPDYIKQQILASNNPQTDYVAFLCQQAIRKAIDMEGIYDSEVSKKYALAFLSGLRFQTNENSNFHDFLFSQFTRSLFPKLEYELQQSVKRSLQQYVNNPAARIVALPVLISISEYEPTRRYIAELSDEKDLQIILRSLIALRYNKHIDQLRADSDVQEFLIGLIKSGNTHIQSLVKKVLVDDRNTAIARVNLLHPKMTSILEETVLDSNQTTINRIICLQILTKDQRVQFFRAHLDVASHKLYEGLVRILSNPQEDVALVSAIMDYFIEKKISFAPVQIKLLDVAANSSNTLHSNKAFVALGIDSAHRFEKRIVEEEVLFTILENIDQKLSAKLNVEVANRIYKMCELFYQNKSSHISSYLKVTVVWMHLKNALFRIKNDDSKNLEGADSVVSSLERASAHLESLILRYKERSISVVGERDQLLMKELSYYTADANEAEANLNLTPDDLTKLRMFFDKIVSSLKPDSLVELQKYSGDSINKVVAEALLRQNDKRAIKVLLSNPEYDYVINLLLHSLQYRDLIISRLESFELPLTAASTESLISLVEFAVADDSKVPESVKTSIRNILMRSSRTRIQIQKLPIENLKFAELIFNISVDNTEQNQRMKPIAERIVVGIKKRVDFPGSICSQTWK